MAMWIEQIFVESFGAYRNLLIDDISPGLSVVIGCNEAGKSTILEFVRSIFFGFRTRTGRANTYETPHGLPRKGWLTVHIGDDARFRVERTERRGLKEGMLTISDPQGNLVDMAAVPVFRAGMDRTTYESLFAFDLDQMRHLDRESLRRKILAATVGSLEVNPLDVRKQLEDRLKTLGKRSVRDPESILGIQTNVRELEEKIAAIADRPAVYWELKQSLQSLEESRTGVTKEIRSTELSLLKLKAIMRYEDAWKQLRAVESEMLGLEDARNFPPDGVQRLEQILLRRREAAETAVELEKGLDQVQDKLKTLCPDQMLLDHSESIQTLNREALRFAQRPSEISAARSVLEQSRAVLMDGIAELGETWNWQRVAVWEPRPGLDEQMRAFTTSWSESRDRIRALETALSESSETVKRIETRIARKNEDLETIKPSCEGFLTADSRQKLQEWKHINSRLPDLEDRLREQRRLMQGLIAAREDLDKRLDRLENESPFPVSPTLFWALTLLFAAAGIGLIVAGLRAADASYYVFPTIGVLIIFALSWLVRWKVLAERRYLSETAQTKEALLKSKSNAVIDLAEVENQRRRIVEQMEKMKGRSTEISSEVLASPSATLDEVLAAEAVSNAAEQSVQKVCSQQDTLQADQIELEEEQAKFQRISESLDTAHAQLAALKENWETFLADQALDTSFEPHTASEFAGKLRDLKIRFRSMADQENALKEMTNEWEEFTGRVLELGHEMDRPVAPDISPVEQAEKWHQCVQDSKEVLSEQRGLLAQAKDNEMRLSLQLQKMREAGHELDALMEAARVNDEDSFRIMAKSHERYRSLAQEKNVLVSSILAGLNYEDEAAMRGGYGPPGLGRKPIRTVNDGSTPRVPEAAVRSTGGTERTAPTRDRDAGNGGRDRTAYRGKRGTSGSTE